MPNIHHLLINEKKEMEGKTKRLTIKLCRRSVKFKILVFFMLRNVTELA